MKILTAALILFLSLPASAEDYLGCGLGLVRQSLPEADWLEPSSDQQTLLDCWYEATPKLQRNGWFLAMPSLHWQRNLRTSHYLSTERSQQTFRHASLNWTFWRQQELLLGIIAGRQQLQHQRQLNQDLLWLSSNNVLLNQQVLSLEQRHQYVGVVLDIRYLDSPIQQIRLTRHYYQQPLLVNNPTTPNTLTDAELKTWQLALARPTQGHGLILHWQAAAAQGEVSSTRFPVKTALSSTDFIDLSFELGLMWRYRYSSHLHPYIDFTGQGQWWIFDSNKQQLPQLTTSQQLGFKVSAGLSWRF